MLVPKKSNKEKREDVNSKSEILLHLQIFPCAYLCLSSFGLDEVYFLPTLASPFNVSIFPLPSFSKACPATHSTVPPPPAAFVHMGTLGNIFTFSSLPTAYPLSTQFFLFHFLLSTSSSLPSGSSSSPFLFLACTLERKYTHPRSHDPPVHLPSLSTRPWLWPS